MDIESEASASAKASASTAAGSASNMWVPLQPASGAGACAAAASTEPDANSLSSLSAGGDSVADSRERSPSEPGDSEPFSVDTRASEASEVGLGAVDPRLDMDSPVTGESDSLQPDGALLGVLSPLCASRAHLRAPSPRARHLPPLPPRPFRRRSETFIIFDWDDTLLSSSWLTDHGLRLDQTEDVPHSLASQLDALAGAVVALLSVAQRCGGVVIITNAETNWVQLSCQKFMPRLWPHVSGLRVVSARSTFEALHPDSPVDWKVQAFFQEICTAFSGTRPDDRKNILSFGDSVHERAAVHRVTSNMGPLTWTKSVKFVERPSVEQLKRQVDLVASCFEEICRHNDHLDLMLTIQPVYLPETVRAPLRRRSRNCSS